jgi:excisionase family DNA binding protein
VERLLSPDETCELIGVRRTTLYRLLDAGEIASIRVGRLRRIPLERLRAWVDKKVVEEAEAQGTRGYAVHADVVE